MPSFTPSLSHTPNHNQPSATGKFKEAAEHALKCFEFYCDGAPTPLGVLSGFPLAAG